MTSNDSGPSEERRRLLALAAALRPDVDPSRLRCEPLARTRNSRVYELSDGAALHWAAKVCVDPWKNAPSAEAARIQFEALASLRDRTLAARVELGRPDPVHLDEPSALVLMTWVEGDSLTAGLRRWPRERGTLDRLVREAGRWLGLLHSVGPRSAGPLLTQRKLGGLADAQRLETARDGAFRRAVALLEAHSAAAAAEPHASSWIHGDFKPDNVLFAGGRAGGIDVQLRNVSSVLEDVAPFLNSLELQCSMPRAWRTSAERGRLVTGFLEGYTGVMGSLPLLPLAWARLYSATALWAYDMTMARNALKAVIAYRLHRRLVARLSRSLATTSATAGTG